VGTLALVVVNIKIRGWEWGMSKMSTGMVVRLKFLGVSLRILMMIRKRKNWTRTGEELIAFVLLLILMSWWGEVIVMRLEARKDAHHYHWSQLALKSFPSYQSTLSCFGVRGWCRVCTCPTLLGIRLVSSYKRKEDSVLTFLNPFW